jgi:hypothetical protein
MTDHRPDNTLGAFDGFGGLLRAATPPPSLQQHLEGRVRLIATVERMRKRSRVRWVLVALAFSATAAAVFLAFRVRVPPPLAWRVENGAIGAQGYVSIAQSVPSARLIFSDGSEVTLSAGSRGRVARSSARGAELVLEQGRARVHVQHGYRTEWVVAAGPFAVRVTGTEFSVAWAADSETLDLWMRSGRVVVAGPVLGDALALVAGQHVRARVHEGTVQIDGATESSEASPTPTSTSTSTPTPTPTSTSTSTSTPTSTSTSTPTSTAAPGTRWARLLAQGDFARVVREAEAQDVSRAIASSSLADLRALGDAARYAGDPGLSSRAYLALRARFPFSEEARIAAFLLGRLAEEQQHANADAIRWYDKYAGESPGGTFAGDALGRKMSLVSTWQGRDTARPLADQYLQRFPGGPYAAAARDLTR